MPAHRKPTLVLEKTGAFKKNPQRIRRDANTHGPLIVCPKDLTEPEAECWRELVDSAPLDVLTTSDGHIVEVAARLLAVIRSSPVLDLTAALLAQYKSCLASLGMTPVDRSKVISQEKKAESPFAAYENAKRQ